MFVDRFIVYEIVHRPGYEGNPEYREIRVCTTLERAKKFAVEWADGLHVAVSVDRDTWEITWKGRETVDSEASVLGYCPPAVCPRCYYCAGLPDENGVSHCSHCCSDWHV